MTRALAAELLPHLKGSGTALGSASPLAGAILHYARIADDDADDVLLQALQDRKLQIPVAHAARFLRRCSEELAAELEQLCIRADRSEDKLVQTAMESLLSAAAVKGRDLAIRYCGDPNVPWQLRSAAVRALASLPDAVRLDVYFEIYQGLASDEMRSEFVVWLPTDPLADIVRIAALQDPSPRVAIAILSNRNSFSSPSISRPVLQGMLASEQPAVASAALEYLRYLDEIAEPSNPDPPR